MQRPISPVLIVLTLLWACAALPGAATAEESQAKDPFVGLPAPSEDAAFAESLAQVQDFWHIRHGMSEV